MTCYDPVLEATQFPFCHRLGFGAITRAPRLPWEVTQSLPVCGTRAKNLASLGSNCLKRQRLSLRNKEGFFG